jgi:hypothetical protein
MMEFKLLQKEPNQTSPQTPHATVKNAPHPRACFVRMGGCSFLFRRPTFLLGISDALLWQVMKKTITPEDCMNCGQCNSIFVQEYYSHSYSNSESSKRENQFFLVRAREKRGAI